MGTRPQGASFVAQSTGDLQIGMGLGRLELGKARQDDKRRSFSFGGENSEKDECGEL